MIKIKPPLVFNTNFEIQGKDGVRLLKVLGDQFDAIDLGNWVMQALNDSIEKLAFVDSLMPFDIIQKKDTEDLVLVPRSAYDEGKRALDILATQAKVIGSPGFPDAPKPKRRGNPNWVKKAVKNAEETAQ